MNLEVDSGFNPELETERLERVPGWDETFLGPLAHGLLHQLTETEELHDFLTERSDTFEELVEKTAGINARVVQWWHGFVENVKAAHEEFFDEVQVIESQPYKITSQGLFSENFGLFREFAIENVRKFRPDDFDPLEAATLEWAERMILEKPGTQVLYGMSCKKNDKIRFLASLTRPSQNSGFVYGKSYRVGELTTEEAEDLLVSLMRDNENRQIETQEIVDEKGQEQTIRLLIVKSDENFVDNIEEIELMIKEMEEKEPQVRLETVWEDKGGDRESSMIGEPPRPLEDIKLDLPETAAVNLAEQGKKTPLFNFSSLKTKDEFKPKESKPEPVVKPPTKQSKSALRNDNNPLSGKSSAIVVETLQHDDAEQLLPSTPVSLSSFSPRRHTRVDLRFEQGRPTANSEVDQQNRETRVISIHQPAKRENLETKAEQPLCQKEPCQEIPWATSVVQNKAAVVISEEETRQLDILEENHFIRIQPQPSETVNVTLEAERFNLASQMEDVISRKAKTIGSCSWMKPTQISHSPKASVQSETENRGLCPWESILKISQQETVGKSSDIAEKSEFVVPQIQGLAAEQNVLVENSRKSVVVSSFDSQPLPNCLVENNSWFEEKTICVQKGEIQLESPSFVVESFQETKLGPQVARLVESRMIEIGWSKDLVIEPEEVESAQAKKIIERLKTIKQLKENLSRPSLLRAEFKRVLDEKLRPAVFNWQILIPQLRLEAKRALVNLSLAELIKELIPVPLTKTRWRINWFEQRENRFSQAILLHSLLRTNPLNPQLWSKQGVGKKAGIKQGQIVFDGRWLPKVIYEAKDPLPLITFAERGNYFDLPMTDIVVPFEKRAVIRVDEYQEVLTIDEVLELEEAFSSIQSAFSYEHFKFLHYPLTD